MNDGFLLVYKDPHNGAIKSLPVPLPDIPHDKVRATIKEFRVLYKYMLPSDEDVHYMLIRVDADEGVELEDVEDESRGISYPRI